MRFLYGAIGVVVVGGLIAALILSSGKSAKIDTAKLNRLASAAGCSALTPVQDQGASHIRPPATFNYNSNPPTSGSHYNLPGQAPAPTGVHTAPIQDEYQVHNLEHGHIGIQYTDALAPSIRTALENLTRQHDTYVFMAPRPQMPAGTQLAFTRWDDKITCAAPTDSAAIVSLASTFISDFQGLGPEGALPGTPISG